MQDNEMSSFMTGSLWDACSIRVSSYRSSRIGLYSKSEDGAKHGRLRARPSLSSGAVIGVEKSHLIFCKLWSVSVVKPISSVGWFQYG